MVPDGGGVGACSNPVKDSAWGSPNKSADTPYSPVGGSKGLQDAHDLPLYVPGDGGGGARSQATKHSASGSPNESADTPYDPVGGPQVPQEAHGKHLFVPGAGSVGEINMTHGYKHRPWTGLSNGTTFVEIGSAVRPWLSINEKANLFYYIRLLSKYWLFWQSIDLVLVGFFPGSGFGSDMLLFQKMWFLHLWPSLEVEIRSREVLAAVLEPLIFLVAECHLREYQTHVLPTLKWDNLVFPSF